ncbi:hypothetical protein C8J57DRAFT_1215962 [Mycena rebaudengoi]|nr:hypothetical protein C8J57DRAFT_1215962 [Mycena rebaudengoi]
MVVPGKCKVSQQPDIPPSRHGKHKRDETMLMTSLLVCSDSDIARPTHFRTCSMLACLKHCFLSITTPWTAANPNSQMMTIGTQESQHGRIKNNLMRNTLPPAALPSTHIILLQMGQDTLLLPRLPGLERLLRILFPNPMDPPSPTPTLSLAIKSAAARAKQLATTRVANTQSCSFDIYASSKPWIIQSVP